MKKNKIEIWYRGRD